jgi:hypothetical protein
LKPILFKQVKYIVLNLLTIQWYFQSKLLAGCEEPVEIILQERDPSVYLPEKIEDAKAALDSQVRHMDADLLIWQEPVV